MTKHSIFFVLLCFHCVLSTTKSKPESAAADFIKAECQATRYPALCVQCLSYFASTIQQSKRQLTQVALSVSLSRAKSTASFVSKLAKTRGMKPLEYGALKDCIENIGDSVDQLSRSMKELGRMSTGQDFSWHVSNVLTWVSAALTDETTCMDGFGGSSMDGNVKVAVRRRVRDCAQVTSNALALVNHFAERHKAAQTMESTKLP